MFVGDYIDRGPAQVETIEIVRRMVDKGTARAIMGNHALNAIAWVTEKRGGKPGEARVRKAVALGGVGAFERTIRG